MVASFSLEVLKREVEMALVVDLPLSGLWLDLMISQVFSNLSGSMDNDCIMWIFVFTLDFSRFCSQHNSSAITKDFMLPRTFENTGPACFPQAS